MSAKLREGKIPRLTRSAELCKVIHAMMRPEPFERPSAESLLATEPRIKNILQRRLDTNWVPHALIARRPPPSIVLYRLALARTPKL